MTGILETYTLEQAEEDVATLRGQVAWLTELAGLQMVPSGSQLAAFPGTTVTAASLSSIATATYTAGDADAGAVYELEAWGNGVQGTTKQTLQFGVSFGGTAMTNITFGTAAFGAVSQAFRWRCAARVICNTAGTAGTWTSYLRANTTDFGSNIAPGNTDFAEAFSSESTGTTAKDTTASQALALQAAWGSATGAPTLTSRVAIFKRIA